MCYAESTLDSSVRSLRIREVVVANDPSIVGGAGRLRDLANRELPNTRERIWTQKEGHFGTVRLRCALVFQTDALAACSKTTEFWMVDSKLKRNTQKYLLQHTLQHLWPSYV